MFVETLENRRLFAASPAAALAKAGTIDTLAQSSPGAVAAVAQPDAPSATLVTPAEANPVATAAQAGTVDTLAKSSPGAVGNLARP